MSIASAPATAATISTEAEALAAADEFALSLRETVIDRDRSGELPVQELARFDATGLLAITVPEVDGGPELPVTTLTEVIRRIAAVDPAIAQAPQGHYLMVDVISTWGTERQRHALLGDVLSGRRIGNALAERGGHHAQDLRTRVHRPVSALRLSGRKYYCTGALTSHWLAVSALDEDDRLVLAIVRRDAEGVELDRDWDVMGQRATVSGGASFDEVEVEFVIDYQNAFEVPQQLGARAQLVHAAIEVGIAGGALRDAHWFVTEKARPFFEAARGGWGLTAAAAGGSRPRPTRTRSTASGGSPPGCGRPRRCSPTPPPSSSRSGACPPTRTPPPAARSPSPRRRRSRARPPSRSGPSCSR